MKKEYDIVTGSLCVVAEVVNNAYGQGWRPEGGLAVCSVATKDNLTQFAQAIVREKDTEGAKEKVDKFSPAENEKKIRRLEKQVKDLQEEDELSLAELERIEALLLATHNIAAGIKQAISNIHFQQGKKEKNVNEQTQ